MLAGLAGALALGLAACGSEDRDNELRPPSPVEMSAKVDNRKVEVSPVQVGAGLAVFTVANFSDDEIQLTLRGPTRGESAPIRPSGVGTVKLDLERGDYRVSAGEESRARPARLSVGPERRSAQNDLLLP